MRRFLLFFSVILLLSLAFNANTYSQALSAVSSTRRGDINEDGKVDIFDLLELLKTLAGNGQTERKRQIADVNASGAVDIFDLLGLLKVLAGTEQLGVIYWGLAITGFSQAGAAAGDTIGIVLENLGENVTAKDIKVYIGMYETGVLELSRYTVKIVVPQAFTGGEVKLVIAADTTNTKYLSLMIRKMIVASSGGLVEHPCGASVDVKAGALNADMQISVCKMSVETAKEMGILEDTSEVLVELGPSGIIFNQPVTISLPLPSNADSADILEAVYYSESKKDWINLPFIQKDYNKKLLIIETDHFSVMKARKWSIKTGVVQGIAFVSIPGGTFQMGGTSYWEQPVHQVTVSAFNMGRYEITQAQYKASMGINPSYFTQDGDIQRPVEQVSWYDAVTFCNRLSELVGLQPCYNLSTWECDFTKNGCRLPTEAEWEYACRAGTTTNYYSGDSESDLGRVGWYLDNSSYTTHPVGGKEANAFGLFDMHGNVLEWCHDWCDENYYQNSPSYNPTGPERDYFKVIRGGSCIDNAKYCRSASRYFPDNRDPSDEVTDRGFRVVRRGTALVTYSLRGNVQEGGSGLTDVSVKITGNGIYSTIITGSDGKYTFSGLASGTYTITPGKTGYTFSPERLQVTISGSDVTAGGITATALPPGDITVVQGITFVLVPGGTFQMGQSGLAEPEHNVNVSSFQMSRYEVSNAQYAAYLNEALVAEEIRPTASSVFGGKGDYVGKAYIELSGSYNLNNRCWISYNDTSFSVAQGKENWPVVFVTWYGAKAFALYYGFDLPREAEWEYAARGGRQYEYGTDDGTISSTKVNYNRNVGYPKDVGNYPLNPFGLFDLAGNVWEWCNDWYGSYGSASQTDPTGPSSGSDRVLRGGNWDSSAGYCRSADRFFLLPGDKISIIGFRVVRR